MAKLTRHSPTLVGNRQYSATVPVYDTNFGLRISGAHKSLILEEALTYEIDFRGYDGANFVDLQRGTQELLYSNMDNRGNHPPNISGLQYVGNSIYANTPYAAYDTNRDDPRYRMRTRTCPITQGTLCTWVYINDTAPNPTPRFIINFSVWEKDMSETHDISVADPGGGEAYYWGFSVDAADAGISFSVGGGYYGVYDQEFISVKKMLYGWHLFTVDNLAGKVYIDGEEVLEIDPVPLPANAKACVLTVPIAAIPLSPNIRISSIKAYDGVSLTKRNLRDLYAAGPQISQERLSL